MKKKQATKKKRGDIRSLEAFKSGELQLSSTERNKLYNKLLVALGKVLWELCKKIVREIEENYCASCGKYIESDYAKHTGHFIAGAVCPLWMYYDLTNLHMQCPTCNFNSGNIPDYERFMIALYGKDHVDYLKAHAGRTLIIGEQKPDIAWYETKIEAYKNILSEVSVRKMQGASKSTLWQCVFSMSKR